MKITFSVMNDLVQTEKTHLHKQNFFQDFNFKQQSQSHITKNFTPHSIDYIHRELDYLRKSSKKIQLSTLAITSRAKIKLHFPKTINKPALLKFYSFKLIAPSPLDRVSTNFVPTSTPPQSIYNSSSQTWFFNPGGRELRNATKRIQLTAIESMLITTLTKSTERICSKQELILGIDKDPNSYSGLEMCLSRLQHKFKSIFEERLFRSVRNRGYCLVQDVKTVD